MLHYHLMEAVAVQISTHVRLGTVAADMDFVALQRTFVMRGVKILLDLVEQLLLRWRQHLQLRVLRHLQLLVLHLHLLPRSSYHQTAVVEDQLVLHAHPEIVVANMDSVVIPLIFAALVARALLVLAPDHRLLFRQRHRLHQHPFQRRHHLPQPHRQVVPLLVFKNA